MGPALSASGSRWVPGREDAPIVEGPGAPTGPDSAPATGPGGIPAPPASAHAGPEAETGALAAGAPEAGEGASGPQVDVSVDAQGNVFMRNRETGMTTVVDKSGKVVNADDIAAPAAQGPQDVQVTGDTVSMHVPETGMTTVVDTATGSVKLVPSEHHRKEHSSLMEKVEDAEQAVLAPADVPRGEPHAYWMEWDPFAKHEDKGSADEVRESPDTAAFRRHLKAFKKYIGLDGVQPEEDAMRIFKIYPSVGDRTDLFPMDDNPAPQDPIADHGPLTHSFSR